MGEQRAAAVQGGSHVRSRERSKSNAMVGIYWAKVGRWFVCDNGKNIVKLESFLEVSILRNVEMRDLV
jgi:hypothetical protein